MQVPLKQVTWAMSEVITATTKTDDVCRKSVETRDTTLRLLGFLYMAARHQLRHRYFQHLTHDIFTF